MLNTLNQWLEGFLERYGHAIEPLRFAIRHLLPTLLPGSQALVDLIDDALGTARDTWRDTRGQAAALSPALLEQGEQIEQALGVLEGSLADLVDRVALLHERADGERAALELITDFQARQPALWEEAGKQLAGLVGHLKRVEAGVSRTEENTLDLLHEQQAQGDKLDRAVELLEKTQTELAKFQAARGPVSPTLTDIISDPREKQLVRDLLAQYRDLPAARRRAMPALVNGLGKLALGVGDARRAEESFVEARKYATTQAERAEAAFNLYRTALEERAFDRALEHFQSAATLDPGHFEPFRLDKYPVEAILGAGGFGVAFKVHQRFMEKPLVIKTLHGQQLGRPIDAILKEAKALQTVRHPGVIELIDVDDRPQPHLVMGFFPGESLGTYVERHGCLSELDLLALAKPLADALAAVHRAGVLHRDLKPDNLLVRRGDDGTWAFKLIDFGLALDQRLLKRLTHGHSILASSLGGTLDYAAPEQLGKIPGVSAGPHSDIYSFGALCCFALTGSSSPRSKDWRKAGISDGLVEVLEDCRDDDVKQRPESFEVLVELLEGLGSSDPPPPPPPPPPQPTMPDARNNIHGWSKERVQARQRQAAQALGYDGVTFQDRLQGGGPRSLMAVMTGWVAAGATAGHRGLGPLMAVIPPGTFVMGSPDGEEGRSNDETQHTVTISRPFGLGCYAVTFDEYDAFCRATKRKVPDDEGWGRGNRPAINISWDDATAFAQWLSQQTGVGYRLPSEAEWEYACRAGTTTPYWWGMEISAVQANYESNRGQITVPVDEYAPNPWGLYQVHGNVWEWVEDAYMEDIAQPNVQIDPIYNEQRGAYRVYRGGSWCYDAGYLRSSSRHAHPVVRRRYLGLRLARTF